MSEVTTAETAGRRGATRGRRRRWALGLGAIALAASPLLALALRPPPAATGPALAPALAPGVIARQNAPAGTVAETAPAPEAEDLAGAAAPAGPCPRDALPADQRSRCLHETIRASEQALEAGMANALRVIDARSDLAPVQRNRWKDLLEEAQSRFLLYRNFDCQSVAPFEGPRGIGNFEERALCLIGANTRRAEALAARYPPPAAAPAGTAPADGPQPRPATWTHPSPPPLD